MTDTIVLISNTNNPQNTLSSFMNELPVSTLNYNNKNYVGLDEIGIHLQIKNNASPIMDQYPSILQINNFHLTKASNINPDDINVTQIPTNVFEFHNKLYIQPTESYDAEKLHKEIEDQVETFGKMNPAMFKGYCTKIDSNNLVFGQFKFPFENIEKSQHWYYGTFLFFHENIYQCLELEDESKIKKIQIANESYYYFSTLEYDEKTKEYIPITIKTSNKLRKMKIQIPRVIKIICPQSEPVITSNGYKNILNMFTVSTEQLLNTYVHIDFSKHIFTRLNTNQINNLHVSFVNENNQPLRLYRGVPTFVKLQLKKHQENMEMFPIFIDSLPTNIHKNNTASRFKIQLPQSVDYGKWKMAVNSISFKNDFLIMNELNLKFAMEYGNNNATKVKKQFVTPPELRTHNEIIEWFLSEISDVITGQQTENGQIMLTFKKKAKLVIEKNLSLLLGGIKFIHDKQVISKLKNGVFLMPTKPKEIQLFPHQLFLYSDIVEPSILGGVHEPLVKIIPVNPPFNTKNYESISYHGENLQYISLRAGNIPQTLDFTLRSTTNSEVEFCNPLEPIFITLLFQRY